MYIRFKKVHIKELPNGVTLYTQPDRESHTALINVNAGAAHDPPDLIGAAHLVEHCCANRTQYFHGSESEMLLRSLSASNWREAQIFTTHMSTAYGCGLLRRRQYIYDLFPLFVQMVKNPVWDVDIFNAERCAVLVEWNLHGTGDIEDRLTQALMEALFKVNPVRKRIDCDPDQMLKNPRTVLRKLRRFWEEQYVSSNISAILPGPERKVALKMAMEAFGDLPAQEAPPMAYDGSEPRPLLTDRIFLQFNYGDKDNHIYHLLMGFPIDPCDPSDVRKVAREDNLDALTEILELSIEEKIRDKNQDPRLGTYHTQVWTERTRLHGMFFVRVPLLSMEGVQRAEAIIVEEIGKLREGHLPDPLARHEQDEMPLNEKREAARRILRRTIGKDIARAMRRPLVDTIADAFINQPQILAEMIQHHIAIGDPGLSRLNTFPKRMERVTRKGIIAAANEYLDPQRYAVALAVPNCPLDFSQFGL